jgi:hypothetical protein
MVELLCGKQRVVMMRPPEGTGADGHGMRRDRKKGPPMRGTQGRPALASYRDAVEEQIKAGEPFGDVEDAIDAIAELTTDEKAALWLFAFSLRDPDEQQLAARSHLAAGGPPPPDPSGRRRACDGG